MIVVDQLKAAEPCLVLAHGRDAHAANSSEEMS